MPPPEKTPATTLLPTRHRERAYSESQGTPPALPADTPAPLRFENVTVVFDDGVKALDNISFNVNEGETRIILGAAASGKTVLLKTAMTLVQPTSGKVFLFGQDVTHKKEQELFAIRSKLGMLFQESALFDSMTVAQNVAYPLLNQKSIQMPRDKMEPAVRESLRFVELEQTVTKFPSELSGGMRRRVAIARAVVTKPPLLLYDSPTAGLDPITAHTIMALIVKERDLDATTALVVTHRYQDGNLVANFRYNPETGRLDPAGTADTKTVFMVLKEGRLVFEGDQATLEASTDDYISKFVKRPEPALKEQ